MQSPNTSTLTLALLLPLIGWRVYARIKRMVGRQRLSRIRPWVTLVIFPLVILLFASLAHFEPSRLAWLGAGLGVGALLAVFGLRTTTFEPTPQGLYYTPNAHLGIALSLLFVGRVVYRLVEITVIHPELLRGGHDDFSTSPLTLGIFGILAGYYIAYAIGLVRWRWRSKGSP